MTISLFACGPLDLRLLEHLLTQAPQKISEAERIALEYLQIRLGINSAVTRLRRNDSMPFVIGDSHPSGMPTHADRDNESELAPPTRSMWSNAMKPWPSSQPPSARTSP